MCALARSFSFIRAASFECVTMGWQAFWWSSQVVMVHRGRFRDNGVRWWLSLESPVLSERRKVAFSMNKKLPPMLCWVTLVVRWKRKMNHDKSCRSVARLNHLLEWIDQVQRSERIYHLLRWRTILPCRERTIKALHRGRGESSKTPIASRRDYTFLGCKETQWIQETLCWTQRYSSVHWPST